MNFSADRSVVVYAVMTVHNRAPFTRRCLEAFWEACVSANVVGQAIVVDDGSTDETSRILEMEGGRVTTIHGDGSLFWNRGMRLGLARVLDSSAIDSDIVLWLNNDTIIVKEALKRLLIAASEQTGNGHGRVVAGATVDPESGALTYGGMKSSGGLRRFNFIRLPLCEDVCQCDTINGNVVLMRVGLLRMIGNLDDRFEHAMGDIDFGLRARKKGVDVVCAPGVAGYCANNSKVGTHRDDRLWSWQRMSKLLGRKELPVKSWLLLTRRHGGSLWFLYFLWPYVRVLFQGILGDIRLVFRRLFG